LYAGKILLAVARVPLSPLSTATTVTAEYPLETEQKLVAMETGPLVAVTLVLDTDVDNSANQNQEQTPSMSPLATALNEHDTSGSSGDGSHSDSIGSHDNSVQSARRSLVEQFSKVSMEKSGHQSLDNSGDHSANPPPTSIDQIQESSGASTSTTSTLATTIPPPVTADQISPPITANQIPPPISASQIPPPITANQIPPLISTNQISSSVTAPLSTLSNHIPSFNSINQDVHHYCVAIDIRSLRLLVDHMSGSMITGHYSYEFFGTPQPVMLPPISATPFVECPFEQSLCAFDFATPWKVLVTQLSNVPLVVELVQNEAVVGGAQVIMSSVLNQPKEMVGAKGSVSRQCIDTRSGVTSW